jgi:hypothetical protein
MAIEMKELSEHVFVAGAIPPQALDTTTALEVTAMQYLEIDEWESVLVLVAVGVATDSDTTFTLQIAHSESIDTNLDLADLSSDTFEMVITVADSDISATVGRVFVGDIDFKAQGWTGGYIQPFIASPGVTTSESMQVSCVFVLYGGQGSTATRKGADQTQTVVQAF